MKVCPTCDKVYNDDEINFCLADGTTLLKKKKSKLTKHSHWNDVVAVIIAAFAVLLLLSLVTSSASDRAFGATGNGAAPRNLVGTLGANIASVLFNTLGWTAYLFPLLIALVAWRVYRADSLMPRPFRVAGFVGFVLSLAGLTSLFGGYGAIVGNGVIAALSFLGSVGTGILLIAIFISSVLLITNFTLAGFAGHFDVAWSNLKIRFDEWRDKGDGARVAELDAAKKRADKRRAKRESEDEAIPPTISVGEPAAKAVAAAVGRAAPAFEAEPSIPTIDSNDNPYETVRVEEPPEFDEIFAKNKASKRKPLPTDDEGAESQDLSRQNFDNYKLPTSDMLTPSKARIQHDEDELRAIAKDLQTKTAEFNVGGKVVNILKGPIVTTYEFKPDAGVKYSRVTGLVDDLCLALKAESIRIDRIPGKAYVGIEVPNKKRETIFLREGIESPKFEESKNLLTLALGKTIDGANYVADLAKMPHLLIAGATGAGKSVGVNTLVMSILYKARPDQVKFIMVDPKRLELGLYADIPHLATPIITDPKRAAISLKWAVTEMERRYKDLAGFGVRNIDGYNAEITRRNSLEMWDDNGEPHRILPYIVIIIDELADLMMVSGKDVEESITRLAQMARAVGIHLVLATQRPSVDVITGLIKANFPSRISFRVSSKVDSRTIIDGNGAESLLGAGDMLFLPPGSAKPQRIHGAFVSEPEIRKAVAAIKKQGKPIYDAEFVAALEKARSTKTAEDGGEDDYDEMYEQARELVMESQQASISWLQRRLRVGYNRAARMIERMEREGLIAPSAEAGKPREVLVRASGGRE